MNTIKVPHPAMKTNKLVNNIMNRIKVPHPASKTNKLRLLLTELDCHRIEARGHLTNININKHDWYGATQRSEY